MEGKRRREETRKQSDHHERLVSELPLLLEFFRGELLLLHQRIREFTRDNVKKIEKEREGVKR